MQPPTDEGSEKLRMFPNNTKKHQKARRLSYKAQPLANQNTNRKHIKTFEKICKKSVTINAYQRTR